MLRRKPQNRKQKPPRFSATVRQARNTTAHLAKTAGIIVTVANAYADAPNLAGAALSAAAYLTERCGALADRSRKRREEHAGLCGELTQKGDPCTRSVKGGGPCWQH